MSFHGNAQFRIRCQNLSQASQSLFRSNIERPFRGFKEQAIVQRHIDLAPSVFDGQSLSCVAAQRIADHILYVAHHRVLFADHRLQLLYAGLPLSQPSSQLGEIGPFLDQRVVFILQPHIQFLKTLKHLLVFTCAVGEQCIVVLQKEIVAPAQVGIIAVHLAQLLARLSRIGLESGHIRSALFKIAVQGFHQLPTIELGIPQRIRLGFKG
ncbi:MAG: Uncharacterised protein [Flavobacteriia bacterium]|nr:MAG: Uncharacterised protein [Flavobacteriia bacterium]